MEGTITMSLAEYEELVGRGQCMEGFADTIVNVDIDSLLAPEPTLDMAAIHAGYTFREHMEAEQRETVNRIINETNAPKSSGEIIKMHNENVKLQAELHDLQLSSASNADLVVKLAFENEDLTFKVEDLTKQLEISKEHRAKLENLSESNRKTSISAHSEIMEWEEKMSVVYKELGEMRTSKQLSKLKYAAEIETLKGQLGAALGCIEIARFSAASMANEIDRLSKKLAIAEGAFATFGTGGAGSDGSGTSFLGAIPTGGFAGGSDGRIK